MTSIMSFNYAQSGPSPASSHPSISPQLRGYLERLQEVITRTNLSLPSSTPRAVSGYVVLPTIDETVDEEEKVELSDCLNLAFSQLQEGKISEAIATLEQSQSLNPDLKISALLIELDLLTESSPEKVAKAMNIASSQEPCEAIAIYKQVIASVPNYFEAYQALCPLLKKPAEKNHFFLQAAKYGRKERLGASFRRERKYRSTSMTQEAWSIADINAFPPYPPELVAFLAEPCHIWPGKTRRETHIVVPLFPTITKNVDGSSVRVPRTLKSLDQLAKTSGFGCSEIGHSRYYTPWQELDENKPAEKEFHWAVLTRYVLPGSLNTTYDAQKHLAKSMGYEMPGFLDAATAILWACRSLNECLFTTEPLAYAGFTRCREKFDNMHVIVGGFDSNGLCVTYNDHKAYPIIGAAGFRKFHWSS